MPRESSATSTPKNGSWLVTNALRYIAWMLLAGVLLGLVFTLRGPPPLAEIPKACEPSDDASAAPSAASEAYRMDAAPEPTAFDRCPDPDEGWRCWTDDSPGAAVPRVAAAWAPQAVDLTWTPAPDISLHPSAAVVVVVQGLQAWIDAQGGTCEGNVRLTLNTHVLTGVPPTICDEETGRILFQLRNLSLEHKDEFGQPTAWRRVLAGRSNTFWTTVEVSVAWGDEAAPLPTDVGWAANTTLWLVPPVNAWLALGGILTVLLFLINTHRGSALLRERVEGRYSLSRTQGAWWFLVVFASWEILCAFQRDFASIGGSSLSLLGIAGGTYSWVRATTPEPTSGKRGRHRPSIGFWRDIVSDDSGPVLHRLQLVAWSLVLGVGYVYGTIVLLQLPEIDPSLLGLMGMSAGGYLVMKPGEIKKAAEADDAAGDGAPPADPSSTT